jgi:hypothetical protein
MDKDSFIRNIILFCTFFTLTPVALVISVFTLVSLSNQKTVATTSDSVSANLIDSPIAGVSVYASLPESLPSVSIDTKTGDARSEIVRKYLHAYDSPLELFSEDIVEAADTYGVDFRLTTAIAQQESNLCKKIPAESYNCWGWGIHSRGTLGFSNYKEAIEAVTKGLREDYIDQGFETVDDIMGKYTPLSQGSWAEGVKKFAQDME